MINLITLSADVIREAGGFTISIVSIFVVFISLGVLVFIFMSIPKLLELNIRKKLKKSGVPEEQRDGIDEILRMIQKIHKFKIQKDEESNIITIHTAQKQYSPWSSKIYGVQNQPVRK